MGRSFGSLGTRVVTQVRRREGCRELRNPLCKGRLESEIMLIVACKATSKVNTVLAYEHSLWSDFRLLLFFFFLQYLFLHWCFCLSLHFSYPLIARKEDSSVHKNTFPFYLCSFSFPLQNKPQVAGFKINSKLRWLGR